MNETAIIRLIRHDELDQLLELYRQLNTEDPVIPPSEDLDNQWNEMFHNPKMKFVVVEDDGKLAAVCVLVIVQNLTRGGRPFGLVENVVTRENHRKKGCGSLILQKGAGFGPRGGLLQSDAADKFQRGRDPSFLREERV